eukprot:TRINITY_DN1897_c0_g2_i1.p1 TRINITY_DN1897_c0_g2~~TRINITY_DN1897_c0_g2_i1.p1  ORF type:complete len:159 (+),score=13.84 TRINITY_DN1897_c0_g2_i1:206-682(+)
MACGISTPNQELALSKINDDLAAGSSHAYCGTGSVISPHTVVLWLQEGSPRPEDLRCVACPSYHCIGLLSIVFLFTCVCVGKLSSSSRVQIRRSFKNYSVIHDFKENTQLSQNHWDVTTQMLSYPKSRLLLCFTHISQDMKELGRNALRLQIFTYRFR